MIILGYATIRSGFKGTPNTIICYVYCISFAIPTTIWQIQKESIAKIYIIYSRIFNSFFGDVQRNTLPCRKTK